MAKSQQQNTRNKRTHDVNKSGGEAKPPLSIQVWLLLLVPPSEGQKWGQQSLASFARTFIRGARVRSTKLGFFLGPSSEGQESGEQSVASFVKTWREGRKWGQQSVASFARTSIRKGKSEVNIVWLLSLVLSSEGQKWGQHVFFVVFVFAVCLRPSWEGQNKMR